MRAMRMLFAIVAMTIGLGALAAPAAAAREGTMSPFAKSEHYLGNGNSQVTLEQFAANPASYLRPGAYSALRQHVARQIGEDSMSDAQFRAFLKSSRVREVPCEGEVITGGLRPNGTVGKLFRGCYEGELKVLVEDKNGNWKPGLLLGCLNPDFTAVVIVTTVPDTPPPAPPTRRTYKSPTQAIQGPSFQPNMPLIINNDGGCCDCD